MELPGGIFVGSLNVSPLLTLPLSCESVLSSGLRLLFVFLRIFQASLIVFIARPKPIKCNKEKGLLGMQVFLTHLVYQFIKPQLCRLFLNAAMVYAFSNQEGTVVPAG